MDDLREQYRRANQHRDLAFVERPYLGTPGAPAQDETNTSRLWAHLNGGFLMAHEYTRWWEESRALRTAAVLGDWSWLNKVRISGPRAEEFLDRISAKSVRSQQVGSTRFTPMLSEAGCIAIEGVTLKLADDDFLFTQSGAQFWLRLQAERLGIEVDLEDQTPDWTCFALQGPRSLPVLEAVTGESFADLRFSRWRRVTLFDTEVIVQRQGVTGEVGYEFLMRTDTGRAHELWRRIRDVGREFGLRELGYRAQMIGHTEANVPTVIRDYLPDRFPADKLPRFARLWATEEELAALGSDLTEHLVTPAGLGWSRAVDLDHDFVGRDAVRAEADAGGPSRRWRALVWDAGDVGDLYAAQFRDAPAPPAPDQSWGQFRLQFHRIRRDGEMAGWASAATHSPTLRRMISHARLDAGIETGDEVTVDWGFPGAPTWRLRATVAEQPLLPDHRRDDPVAAAGAAPSAAGE
jgi:vanillate/3-O-methylgallate O-demethylase